MESPYYAKGSRLSLTVLQDGCDRGLPTCGQQVAVEVIDFWAPTMSAVMKVSFQDARSGQPRLAVLKMYDRRFSPSLRRPYPSSYNYSDDLESAWRAYVRDGKVPALFAFLNEKRRREREEGELIDTDSDTDPSSSDDDDDDDSNEESTSVAKKDKKKKKKEKRIPRTAQEMREKQGKREGIMQWKALDFFACETRAYATLAHLHGRYIPTLLAQVYLTVEDVNYNSNIKDNENNDNSNDDTNDDDDENNVSPIHRRPYYFKIPGILIEYIDGFNLTDLGSPATPDIPKSKWHTIIQQAVNAARYINDAGVINQDCQPRNVVVQRRDLRPVHIDFAQCSFADDLGWTEFGELRFRRDNQGAIGVVMLGKVKRKTGVLLPEVRYSYRDWGRFGGILSCLSFVVTPWLGIGCAVGVGVAVLAWAVAGAAGVWRT